MYTGMLDAIGVAYGVLVQVSVHGTDNRLMLETLRAHPQRLRGVAVVDPGLPERDYAALREQGVRGLRINALFAGGPTLQALEEYDVIRSEEHTSELQSLMRISYAVFCLKKKKLNNEQRRTTNTQTPLTHTHHITLTTHTPKQS